MSTVDEHLSEDAVTTDEEDLIVKPHQGSSSWWSDPNAVSSDATQAQAPGYEDHSEDEYEHTTEANIVRPQEEEDTESSEGDPRPELFDPVAHTIPQVEAHIHAHPEDLARVLELEHDSPTPRSSLIAKLEGMS